MAEQDKEKSDNSDVVKKMCQTISSSILGVVKASNSLPAAGDDFDFYSSYESFRSLMDVESTRDIQIIQRLMKYCGLKGSLTALNKTDTEELFDVLVDANDQLLERAGMFMDEAEGLKKDFAPLVVASMTPRQNKPGQGFEKMTPGSLKKTFRLLSGKHVERSQLKFKDKVDNSDRPFVPKLKEKPNAIIPLSESLRQHANAEELADLEEFCHPYQHELEKFEPSTQQLQRSLSQKWQALEKTPLKIIKTEQELDSVIAELQQESVIAIDLEAHSYRSFQGFVCLMQISTVTTDYIIDALDLRHALSSLNLVFTDPAVVKVFHGADQDIEWLQRDFGLYVVNMFDTGQASRALNFPRFSLATLLEHYCNVTANKQFQLADWRMRPLPDELIAYAREDTHYLLYIYDQMKNELLDRSNGSTTLLRTVLQRSKAVCSKVYKKPKFDPEGHLQLYHKSKKVFNSQQMFALQSLYTWRNGLARSEDESIGFVLPNHMLLQIAENLPREPQGIIACCNPVPPLVKQNLSELHALIKTAREQPLSKGVPLHPRPVPTSLSSSTVAVSNLLRCPHDIRKNKREVFVQATCETAIKDKPALVIFANTNKSSLTPAQRLVEEVKSSFACPFEQYMPLETDALSTPEHVETQDNIQVVGNKVLNKWRLVPNAPKPVKQNVPKKPVVLEKIKTEATMKMEEPLEQAVKRSSDEAADEPVVKKVKPNTQQLAVDNLKEQGFQPFDYSKVDYSQVFQASSSSNKFDPNKELSSAKHKTGKKSNVWQPTSAKSVTYSQDRSQTAKIHWPKK